ncbi:MAG: DUF3027 domain-containing protein [Pseudolysinimonas sp.]|uniref:DUF3027 domain-containing protein n=1 Tax=Pseudolysinimonas sp. TaxID=2680009 RepID=UPI003264B807
MSSDTADTGDTATFEGVARAALAEITTPDTIGVLISQVGEDDGVVTLNFVSTLPGYPGWHWSVSAAQVAGEDPTVLEAELMPGDGALVSPDWVPWVDRLEEYRAAQAAAGLLVEGDDDLEDDDVEDDDDEDDLVDGIDFESDELVAAPLGVDEQDEAEGESDEDSPERADVP